MTSVPVSPSSSFLLLSAYPHPSISLPLPPIPLLSSDWNLETHLLSCSQTQLRPCQVVCTRPPSVLVPSFPPPSLLPSLFSLFCSLLSSLSPRRLLQTLWRICPNYLSYWQLRVNKPGKYVAFSVSHSPPSSSPSLPPPTSTLSCLTSNQPSPSFQSITSFPRFSFSLCALHLNLPFFLSCVAALSVLQQNYGEAGEVFVVLSSGEN